MVEEKINLSDYTINLCQRAKDGRWIADEVKVRANEKGELNLKLKEALVIAVEQLADLNKNE